VGINTQPNTNYYLGTFVPLPYNLTVADGIAADYLNLTYNLDATNGTGSFGNVYAYGNITCMSLTQTSDRNAKENFSLVNPEDVLAKVAALPITRWNFKADVKQRHIGPMAQDFYAAFNVGPDDRHIAVVDEGGVALAAIKGLNQKLDEKDSEIQKLKQQNETLEKRLENLEQTIKSITDNN